MRDDLRVERDMLADEQAGRRASNFGLESDSVRYDQACINEAILLINCELSNRRWDDSI